MWWNWTIPSAQRVCSSSHGPTWHCCWNAHSFFIMPCQRYNTLSIHMLWFWILSIILFLFKTKYNVSETGFSLRLQVEPTQLGPIDRSHPYLWAPAPTQDRLYKYKPRITQTIHTYPILCWCRHPETGTSSIDWAQLSRFNLKMETKFSLQIAVCFKKKRQWLISRNAIFALIYNHCELLDLIYF
jgi:hypothetical protein